MTADTGACPRSATDPRVLPRAILFDWDNTLVDSWACIHGAYNATLAWAGLPLRSLEETRACVRLSLRDSFPELFGARWQEAREVYYAEFEARHLEMLAPLPGAGDLLELLSARGIYLGVVSNKTGRFLRAEAAALGWDRYFGRLVGATDAAADKPSVEPVEMALAPLGIGPGPDVWFVGDADVDMRCAHAAGCIPVLVGKSLDVFEHFPPAHRYENCFILSNLVRRLGDTILQESSARTAVVGLPS